MININVQFIFFSFKKLIAIEIVFHISYQCAILSKIILNITLHDSNCNRLLRHFIPKWLLMININAQIILFPLKKLIAITIIFHISYQCAIMLDITLRIILQRSNYNRLLRHYIPQWLLMNSQIIFFALQKLIPNNNCIFNIMPMCHFVRNHFKHHTTWFEL